jgi:hypothetical protein
MRLAIENYPTPQGKTCDVVDLDRDGGEGRPLIVARFFEPEYAAAFVAFPALLAACRLAGRVLADKPGPPPPMPDEPGFREHVAAHCAEFLGEWSAAADAVRNALAAAAAGGRCGECNATLVVCKLCGAAWCMDHQPAPLRCPGCGKYPRDGS